MPIKIPNELPATRTLTEENIFVMTETRAMTQDIRPLKILLLNLMPTKIEIPVYIGGDMIDEIVVTAQQRMNLRSGGR